MASSRDVHRVAVLCFSPVSVFEMAVPCEIWGMDRTAAGVPPSEVRICTADPLPLDTSMGFTIDTANGLEALRWAQTIVIPGWPRPNDTAPDDEVLRALRRAHQRGARLASLCSGAFVLAAAGLLDGRRATTHWMYCDDLRTYYPTIDVDPSTLYIGDGRLFTSAGTAAGIDLCLHLVRLDHGAEVANIVARRMVVPPHRVGGQAQFVETPVPAQSGADGGLSEILDWIVAHLDEPHTVEGLARRAAMSPRTFARRFRATTGSTPLQWVLSQRVVRAQHLLETTNLPVERIAHEVGFGSAVTLREHFGRVLATTPQQYRRQFRGDGDG